MMPAKGFLRTSSFRYKNRLRSFLIVAWSVGVSSGPLQAQPAKSSAQKKQQEVAPKKCVDSEKLRDLQTRMLGSAEVAECPRPHESQGISIAEKRPHPTAKNIAKSLLYLPRRILQLSLVGPRLGFWAYDQYDLRERFFDIFFNEDRTIGVFPMMFFETGFGLNAGVHLIHRQTPRTKVHVRAGYGTSARQVYSATLSSHSLAKRFALRFQLLYSTHPNSRFFGIGNGDLIDSIPASPIDPITDNTAVATRYRHNDLESTVEAAMQVTNLLSFQLRGSIASQVFRDNPALGRDEFLADAYDAVELVGYEEDLRNFKVGLGAIYDSRTTARSHLWRVTPSTGNRWSTAITYQYGLGQDPSRFARLEGQFHHWFNLYRGDRVLVVGLNVETIVGNIHKIPFVDLATLGGTEQLRGYRRGRFRDKIAASATIEYNFLVQERMSMYTFVDAGRVWRDLDSLTMRGIRVGFGGGLRIHSRNTFIARLLVASSRSGGITVHLLFNPVLGIAPERL